MPYEWTIDTARRLLTLTATGLIDYDIGVQAIRDLVGKPDFDPRFGILVDLREAGISPTLNDLDAFADRMVEQGLTKGLTAIVVSGSGHFLHARQLGTFGKERGLRIEAFTSIRSALRWLGVPE